MTRTMPWFFIGLTIWLLAIYVVTRGVEAKVRDMAQCIADGSGLAECVAKGTM